MIDTVVIEGEVELVNQVDGDPNVIYITGDPHYRGSYEVTPSLSEQVLETNGKVMDNDVTVHAMKEGLATLPIMSFVADPNISFDKTTGKITATVSGNEEITPLVEEGYISEGTPGKIGYFGNKTLTLDRLSGGTIRPRLYGDYTVRKYYYLTGNYVFKSVTIDGLTADKVVEGNVVRIGDELDPEHIMRVEGTAVVPSGTKQVAITKNGTVTEDVTRYENAEIITNVPASEVDKGTKSIATNGTHNVVGYATAQVAVPASEVDVGTKEITSNGTYDVVGFATADVDVPNTYTSADEGKVVSNGALVGQTTDSTVENGTFDTTLINEFSVNVPVYPHYEGDYVVTPSHLEQKTLDTDGKIMDNDVIVEAVKQGSATTPTTTITKNPNFIFDKGTGKITASYNETRQITPEIVTGYVTAGTSGNVTVTGNSTLELDVQGAQTIHPASTDQSIASGKYLTGAQTFKAVTVTGLTADKILQGNTVKIGDADDDDRIMSVTGTASGGITPTGTKTITANGTGIDVYSYQYADVAVPNSYSAGDEGKVVSNGALVAQTSDTVTANDTYDTTLINSLTVNVSGSSGWTTDGIANGTEPSGQIVVTVNNIVPFCFTQNTELTGITADSVTSLNQGICTQCSKLVSVSFANATSTNGSQQFINCTKLANVNLPKLTAVDDRMFQGCSSLKFIDLPKVTTLNKSYLFRNCYKLSTVVLRHTSVVAINKGTFANTPLAGYNSLSGTVYVPQSLISSYQSATNWSTLYNNGTCTFVKIEGSIYE